MICHACYAFHPIWTIIECNQNSNWGSGKAEGEGWGDKRQSERGGAYLGLGMPYVKINNLANANTWIQCMRVIWPKPTTTTTTTPTATATWKATTSTTTTAATTKDDNCAQCGKYVKTSSEYCIKHWAQFDIEYFTWFSRTLHHCATTPFATLGQCWQMLRFSY